MKTEKTYIMPTSTHSSQWQPAGTLCVELHLILEGLGSLESVSAALCSASPPYPCTGIRTRHPLIDISTSSLIT